MNQKEEDEEIKKMAKDLAPKLGFEEDALVKIIRNAYKIPNDQEVEVFITTLFGERALKQHGDKK